MKIVQKAEKQVMGKVGIVALQIVMDGFVGLMDADGLSANDIFQQVRCGAC